jgi:hypothetical protein
MGGYFPTSSMIEALGLGMRAMTVVGAIIFQTPLIITTRPFLKEAEL